MCLWVVDFASPTDTPSNLISLWDYFFVQLLKWETRLECDTKSELQHNRMRHLTLKAFISVAVLSVPTFNNLQMTLTIWPSTKTEKYFFNIKLVSVASTIRKVKFQVSDSFDIASIYPAYLNTRYSTFFGLSGWSLTCLFSLYPPIIQCCPFKVAPHDPWTSVSFSKSNLSSRLT